MFVLFACAKAKQRLSLRTEREGEHHIRIKNEVEVWIWSESWIGLRMLMPLISLGELIRVQRIHHPPC